MQRFDKKKRIAVVAWLFGLWQETIPWMIFTTVAGVGYLIVNIIWGQTIMQIVFELNWI